MQPRSECINNVILILHFVNITYTTRHCSLLINVLCLLPTMFVFQPLPFPYSLHPQLHQLSSLDRVSGVHSRRFCVRTLKGSRFLIALTYFKWLPVTSKELSVLVKRHRNIVGIPVRRCMFCISLPHLYKAPWDLLKCLTVV